MDLNCRWIASEVLLSYPESENLSKLRITKLEASNQDVVFWNELKTSILNRQKAENAELLKATARVA